MLPLRFLLVLPVVADAGDGASSSASDTASELGGGSSQFPCRSAGPARWWAYSRIRTQRGSIRAT
jgi:hypothetical protein